MSHLEIPSYPNALLRQGYVVPMDNYTTLLYSALLYSTLLCLASVEAVKKASFISELR